ncbi:unnamed protein product [Cuscuta epithymum]|uniref:BZIP domain-containing protein n=1 Tax=Cuscuta epithymum TaxID=186058 RepID=A0AAV0E7T4_9ASTE|nr:unnamed protein product [Cuscuta epithymum]
MLSAIPATFDSLFSNPFPDFPWDSSFDFQPHEPAVLPTVQTPVPQEPVISNSSSGSYDEKPNPKSEAYSNSGSDEGTRKRSISTNSGSEVDERKRRRMISNRESARRSRMRKQKHLENLRNQANRQKMLNRELLNRVQTATAQCQMVNTENERLRAESAVLRQRLWDMHQFLILRQLQQQVSSPASSAWPYNYNVEQQRPQSLITR